MKLSDIKTTHILAIITIVAILCKDGGVAVILWILYGLYKLDTQ